MLRLLQVLRPSIDEAIGMEIVGGAQGNLRTQANNINGDSAEDGDLQVLAMTKLLKSLILIKADHVIKNFRSNSERSLQDEVDRLSTAFRVLYIGAGGSSGKETRGEDGAPANHDIDGGGATEGDNEHSDGGG